MDVPGYYQNGHEEFRREYERAFQREYEQYYYDDVGDGYRPAQSFPARPGQLRHEQLLQVPIGSILRIYHDNDYKLWRLVGFGPRRFSVERVVDGRLVREEHFYSDYCLLPYDTGTWNSANWVALERFDLSEVRPVGRRIKPPKRDVMPKLDWRRFGF